MMKFNVFALGLLLTLPCGISAAQTASSAQSGKSFGSDKQERQQAPSPEIAYMDYVRDNLVATLYHELGHALIDMLHVPVLGQEEDAADVLSAILIHERHNEAEGQRMARNSALAYAHEADQDDKRGDLSLWDEHGPARQRYYNTVCIYYGGRPDARQGFADELALPAGRQDTCADEFDLAASSWLGVLEELRGQIDGKDIMLRQSIRGELEATAATVIADAVEAFNQDYTLPSLLTVQLKRCSNDDKALEAFFTTFGDGPKRITICTQYVQDLYRISSGER